MSGLTIITTRYSLEVPSADSWAFDGDDDLYLYRDGEGPEDDETVGCIPSAATVLAVFETDHGTITPPTHDDYDPDRDAPDANRPTPGGD